uniref:Uncharacterized protein n=1 Tax=Rhizophora mucronata TaxID=61149 RepID=A0A2P2JH03_RHIMU
MRVLPTFSTILLFSPLLLFSLLNPRQVSL